MEDFSKFAMNSALDSGAKWAEVRHADEKVTSFYFDNDVPVSSGFSSDNSIFVRFLANNSMGTIFIINPTKTKITDSLRKQIRITKASSRINKEGVLLSEEKSVSKKYAIRQKIKLDSVSDEKKLSLLSDAYSSLKKGVKYFDSSSIGLTIAETKKVYLNSNGTSITTSIPELQLNYFFTLRNGVKSTQRMNYLAATGGWEVINNWNISKLLVDEANNLTNVMNNAVKAPKGEIDFVVSSEVTGIMAHEAVGHPFEADRILGRESAQAGESFVKPDMIGRKIGSNLVNVVDNPLIEGSAGYYRYDEEGVKSKERLLMKKGIINEFLHDRTSAAKMGLKSNASARISDNSKEPLSRMANTYVLPGKSTEASLIKDVKKGIYMKNFMEWNIDDTRFNFKAKGNEAYLIENGEITKPVLFPNLEVDTITLWTSVAGVGNKKTFGLVGGNCGKGEPIQGAPVTMGGPSLLLRGIKI